MGETSGSIAPLGAAGDVVAHVLVHVPVADGAVALARAASLYDPRYVSWARAMLPAAAVDPPATDGLLLGNLVARDVVSVSLQRLLIAFADEETLGAAVPLAASQLNDPWLRAHALEAPPVWEITWAAIGLAWPAYREAWHRVVEGEVEAGVAQLGEAMRAVAAVLPAMARERVQISHPLGSRARCFDDVILAGVPGSWSGLTAADVAARVVHEAVVRRASRLVASRASGRGALAHWAETEGLALEAATRRLAGTAIAAAHVDFVSGLDRSGVVAPRAALLAALLSELE